MSGMDVYNFLYIVISGGGTNSNTACLGEKSWWSNGSGWSGRLFDLKGSRM